MFKKTFYLLGLFLVLITNSGCSLLSAAISAGAAYGIYQATK